MRIMKKIISRFKKDQMGMLPVDLDRTSYQARVDKIKSLPLIAQFIVLEFETNFKATVSTGPSFGVLLENVVNSFETQFKTREAPVILVDAVLSPLITFFSYAGVYPFLNSLFMLVGCSTYTVGNYSQPFLMGKINPTYLSGVGGALNLSPYYTNVNRTNLLRYSSVGTTGINADLWSLVNLRDDGLVHYDVPNYPSNLVKWAVHLTPTEFFSIMKSAIAAIKWLESEWCDVPIFGNIDGVKVASYEGILNEQLNYINNLSDIVAKANIQLVLDGQAKKDSISKLITEKLAEIDAAKAYKRKNISTMNNLANNFDSILLEKQIMITKSLTGV